MRIHTLLHAPFEGPGAIRRWARARGYRLTSSALYRGSRLPEPAADDWLLVMGGPMSASDEQAFPWLAKEKLLIERAIARGTTVLGVCLGAQLIAAVLGARVYANAEPEIGWFPITLTPQARHSRLFCGWPGELEAFHWHGDTFELPPGAQFIAHSRACRNQAFTYGRNVAGLQFHLELGAREAAVLINNCRADLVARPWIQTPQAMLAAPERFGAAHALLESLLDRLAGAS